MSNINKILVKFVQDLKFQVEKENLRWIEPIEFVDQYLLLGDPEGTISYIWTGNGPQGTEPARFMACSDSDIESKVYSSIICNKDIIPIEEQFGLFGFKHYLKLNGW